MNENEAKHTPGPWEIREGIIGHSGTVAVAEEDSFDWVCSMQLSNQPNWHADARLIAAAPETAAERDALKEVCGELVKALGEMLKAHEKMRPCFPQRAYGIENGAPIHARKALAKAKELEETS